MSFSDLKFQADDFTNQDIASLPDRVTGQAEALKARFDNIGKNMLALGKFNDLCDALDASITQTLGMSADKVPSELAVTNAMVNAGMGDMLASVYDPTGKQQDVFAYAAPADHTHEQTDITGLDTALDGKASASHTHEPTDLTAAVPVLKGGTGATNAASATQTLLYRGEAADLNESLNTGIYATGDNTQNSKVWGTCVVIRRDTQRIVQINMQHNRAYVYMRASNDGGSTWEEWRNVYTSACVHYSTTEPWGDKGFLWLKPIE